MLRLNIVKRNFLKNYGNIRYYRPLNYDSEPTNIEKIKKYDLPIEVVNTLKEHEISISNIEKQLIESNKLIYSLLKVNNEMKEKMKEKMNEKKDDGCGSCGGCR